MITLRDKESGAVIGSITESDLKVLIDALEEESSKDQDYYVDADTLAKIKEDSPYAVNAVQLLQAALGEREGMEIVWSRA